MNSELGKVKILHIRGPCNQNCVYCCQSNRIKESLPSTYYKKFLTPQIKRVVLSGCECLLYPEIKELIKYSHELGISEIELQSNGLLFCYERIAKQYSLLPVTEFNINFPSIKNEVNDKLTQTRGSLKLRIKGVKNLLKYGCNTRLTFVINSLNYNEMPEFISFCNSELKGVSVIFYFIQYAGNVHKNTKLIPRYSEIEPFLNKALDLASKYSISVLVDNFPVCLMKPFMKINLAYLKEVSFQNYVHTKQCNNCKLNQKCPGIDKDYFRINGDNELEPVK